MVVKKLAMCCAAEAGITKFLVIWSIDSCRLALGNDRQSCKQRERIEKRREEKRREEEKRRAEKSRVVERRTRTPDWVFGRHNAYTSRG